MKLRNAAQQLVLVFGLAVLFSQPAFSQATLVPNAQQQFFDVNGNPLSNGKVYMTVPNTGTPKTTWKDPTQTQANTSPIQLDAGGWATIFGQGNYNQRVVASNNNQIWNKFTAAYGSSVPSGATGTDTAPVGSIVPYSGFTIPVNWALASGQAVARVTYPDLLAAITIRNTAVSCIASSVTLTGFASTAQMRIGAPIEASCLSTSVTVASILSPTSITVSAAASVSTTTTATVFPWGNGDGVNTINVPDLRGRVVAGPDAMGGTAANRLTSSTKGGGWATPAIGGSTETNTLATPNLPPYTPLGTLGGTVTTSSPIKTFGIGGGSGGTTVVEPLSGGGTPDTIAGTASMSGATFTGTAQGGTSTPFGVVQPTVTINYMIKMAPNTSGLGGVVSLGGMFGDIVCDVSITCASQTIGVSLGALNPTYFANTSAATLFGNPTNGAAQPVNFSVNGLSQKIPPDANNDRLLLWDSVAGSFKYVTPGQIASAATAGVSSLGGATGAITIGNGLIVSSSSIATAEGVAANVLNAKTANYTILNTDCGKTIQAGTGSSGFFAVTLPSVSGFAGMCKVVVTNGDTVRAKTLSGFPSNVGVLLYPAQSVEVAIVNGAWKALKPQGRWLLSANVSLYVDAALGSDANDGLATGAGAFASVSAAVTSVANNFDLAGNYSVTINVPGNVNMDASHVVAVAGSFVGAIGPNAAAQVIIDMNGTGSLTTTSTFAAVSSTFNGNIQVQNGTIHIAIGGTGIICHFGGKMTLANVVLDGLSAGGGASTAIFVSDESFLYGTGTTIGFSGTFTANIVTSLNASTIIFEQSTININSNLVFQYFAFAQGNSVQQWSGATINLNGFAAIGTKFNVADGGRLMTKNIDGDLSYFPGHIGGIQRGIAQYDTNQPSLPLPAASIGPCAAAHRGQIAMVTDATVNTWGTIVNVGGGANVVQVWCNGTNWTVTGK